MDSLTQVIRLFASTIGFGNEVLLKRLEWGALNAKICAILAVILYHGIVNILIRKKVRYTIQTAQWGMNWGRCCETGA